MAANSAEGYLERCSGHAEVSCSLFRVCKSLEDLEQSIVWAEAGACEEQLLLEVWDDVQVRGERSSENHHVGTNGVNHSDMIPTCTSYLCRTRLK